jgi:hypothetical protein
MLSLITKRPKFESPQHFSVILASSGRDFSLARALMIVAVTNRALRLFTRQSRWREEAKNQLISIF